MRRGSRLAAIARGAVGAAALAAAAFLAARHPVAPWLAATALAAWCLAAWRWPTAWLFVVPAALPWLDFSPWTGWQMVQEFDLLVLGTVGIGWLRRARMDSGVDEAPSPPGDRWLPAVMLLLLAVGLARGLVDADSLAFSLYGDHASASNTLRVSKPLLWLALLLPLLRASTPAAWRLLPRGMVAGLAVVALAAAWERWTHPGLFELARPYRTVALFWEMHVGGAAIDAYLALAVPFAAWAVWRARTPVAWAGAAALAVLVCYAALTTFSRGVYLAVSAPLLALALAAAWQRFGVDVLRRAGPRWRRLAGIGLAVALAAEIAAVLAPDSFMRARLARSDLDAGSRLAHWQQAVAQLKGPVDWVFGLGAGRLPSHYARSVPGHEFSGDARWVDSDGGGHVEIAGPRSDRRLGGLWGLTQRVPLRARYTLHLDVRVAEPTGVYLRVCDTHLLYDGACLAAYVPVRPTPDAGWQRLRLALGDPGAAPADASWRHGVLTLSVVDAGGRADIDNVVLADAAGVPLLANGGFDDGLARWLPVAQFHFLPWHADNLALEWLVERGLLGLAAFGAAVVMAWRRLGRADDPLAPFLAACLGGALLVGAVSSVLDVPRVALLLGLLWALALLSSPSTPAASKNQRER